MPVEKVTPEKIDAAVERVLSRLRKDETPFSLVDGEDDTQITFEGWVSLRHIVQEALEGAADA